jgi:alpha-L-fucosidase
VSEVWFDGSLATVVGDILQQYAPHAMIFQGPHATIRWGGNEHGVVPYPCWTTVSEAHARSGVATAANSDPEGAVWLPVEADAPMRDMTWFWNRNTEDRLFSLETFVDMYYRSVGHGQVLLLGASPDTSGLIPELDARRMGEFGREIRRRFGRPVGETRGTGQAVELHFPVAQPIDHAVIMEDIRGGERIREYSLEGMAGNAWRVLATGSAVGHKKIDVFPAQTVSRLRLRVVRSVGEPLIHRLAAFHVGAVPALDRQAGIVCNLHGDGTRIGGWEDDLGADGKIIEIDITWLCWQARQYQVVIQPAPGTRIEPGEVMLSYDGMPMPEFVTPTADPCIWNINITALGSRKSLRIRLCSRDRRHAAGAILLR